MQPRPEVSLGVQQSNTWEQVNTKGILRSFVGNGVKKKSLNTVGICLEVILQFVARLPVYSIVE